VRSRSFVTVALALLVLFAVAGSLLAYDSAHSDTIANGIKVGGIDVGGLTTSKARARLQRRLAQRLEDPVLVTWRGRRFALSPHAAGVTIDIDASVRQALARSRSDVIFVRVLRSLTGSSIRDNIEPRVDYSSGAVRRFVSGIAAHLDRPAHNATVSLSGDSIGRVPSTRGQAVRTGLLMAAVEAALTQPKAARAIAAPVRVTYPTVTTGQLAARYPTIITIDRGAFTLRLWKQLQLVKSYTIAVGRIGLETPAGLYHIQDKEVDPSWHVPNSSWAGSLAGQTIPPGPQDPLKARWMGIFNGAGIHGTDDLSSLGTAASHGCIRMAIPDVIELYGQTPLGTPVYIA
jgi:lipoprotein-anchoring transpeptidase ErfK/SrfK